jgi:thiopeptide-type bacteriocin biosynthesis protein
MTLHCDNKYRFEDIEELNFLSAVLSDRSVEKRAQAASMPVDIFVAFEASFIAAGLAEIRKTMQAQIWTQVNLTLAPREQCYETLVCGPLTTTVKSWLAVGFIKDFFFMHKLPGLRLRFRSEQSSIISAVIQLMDQLIDNNTAMNYTFGTYEPEQYLFGGPVGMDFAHSFFTADSLLVLDHFKRCVTGDALLPSPLVSLIMLDRMLVILTGDPWEAWDVWMKVYNLRGGIEATSSSLDNAGNILDLAGYAVPISVAEILVPGLGAFEDRIVAISQRMQQALITGQLMYGIRQILPFWVAFHWNRMGFGLEMQQHLAALMVKLRHPG